MGTIIIRDPQYCADYIRPHPNGLYGIYRLAYLGTGAPVTGAYGNGTPVTPEAVAEALAKLQEGLPLGILGDYEILCTDMQIIAYDDDPASGYASAITQPGWIGLSHRVDGDLADILAHELAHALEDHLTDAQREAFWQLVGQEPGTDDTWWQLRPGERLAEYLSAAIWGTPIDSRVLAGTDPDPTEETLAQIRAWALPILGRGGLARITIGEEPRVVLTIGSKTMLVDGRPVQLDVAPFLLNDARTMVPVRAIAEALGLKVGWDQAKQQVTITGDRTIVLTIGSQTALVDGRPLQMDVAPTLINDARTVVPVRFVAEAFGCGVQWDQAKQQVLIY